jgi:ABC-type multidrug transport system fused ATPase/permease subunit
MKLRKSKASAFVLSAIIVLTFAVVSAVVDILIPYLVSGNVSTIIENPQALDSPGEILALVAVIAVLLAILVAIGAYCLYKFFGDAYYGSRGAWRWGLFGALFAVFVSGAEWVFPENLWLLKDLWQFLSLFIAFFLARKFIPLNN